MSASPLGPGADKVGDYAWIYALYELGRTAASGAGPQVQQDILEHIVSGLDAQSGSIALLVDGTEDLLEVAAGIDLPPGVLGSRLARIARTCPTCDAACRTKSRTECATS